MYFKTLPKIGYPWKDKNKKQHHFNGVFKTFNGFIKVKTRAG